MNADQQTQDDWKGEHLIYNVPRDAMQRRPLAKGMSGVIARRKRVASLMKHKLTIPQIMKILNETRDVVRGDIRAVKAQGWAEKWGDAK